MVTQFIFIYLFIWLFFYTVHSMQIAESHNFKCMNLLMHALIFIKKAKNNIFNLFI